MTVQVPVDVLNRANAVVSPILTDLQLRVSPVLNEIKTQGKVHYYGGKSDPNGGNYAIQFPLAYQDQTSITDLSQNQYANIDLSVQQTTTKASFTFATAVLPVALSDVEGLSLSSEAQINLALDRQRYATAQLARALESQIIRGSSSGDMVNFNTLNGLQSGGFANGFLEDLAPGSQTRSVGGVSKASVTAPLWQNQYATASGNFATNGLGAFYSLFTNAFVLGSQYAKDDKVFHVAVLHPETFRLLTTQLQTQVRFTSEEKFNLGGPAVYYMGAKVFPSSFFSVGGNITGGGGAVLSGYALNLDDLTLAIHEKADFTPTDWERNPAIAAQVCRLQLQGALIAKSLGRQGVLMAATA